MRDIDADPDRAALVRALAGYAQQTGAHLVAEGVETEGELTAVKACGVTLIQGYYFGRPAPPWPAVYQEGSQVMNASTFPARA